MEEATTEIRPDVTQEATATQTTEATAATTAVEKAVTEEVTTEQAASESSIPDNWRDLLTGGNEDVAKLINRYSSPANIGKALLEKEQKIRAGATKIERPKDFADEKAMADWRKAMALPDDATGYKLNDKVVSRLSDDDKPVFSNYTEFAHKRGIPQEYVNDMVEWYLENKDSADQAMREADTKAATECEDRMRGEWAGAEYRGNLTLATRFIEQELGMPFQEFCAARLPDGRKIGNVPELVMAFSNKGRETFGDSAFANTDVAQKFEDRKKFIENIRDTDFPRYEREFAKEMNSIIETELKRSKK